MAYAMHLRKSREDFEAEKKGEGETLSRHYARLVELAARLNITIDPTGIYREIISGDSIASRPVMQQLLRDVQDGKWEGVLCVEISRLSRGDTMDQAIIANAFKSSGTLIVTPDRTYDPNNDSDETFFDLSLFLSRFEYKAINKRQQAGREDSVKQGLFVSGKRPFGWNVVHVEKGKGYTLEPHPVESPVLRQMYDLYFAGYTPHQIAERINAQGVFYNGTRWERGRILTLLKSHINAGYVQWHQKESQKVIRDGFKVVVRVPSKKHILQKGLHNGIITDEEWKKVFEISASRKIYRNSTEKMRIDNCFTGLLKCGYCGFAIVKKPDKRRDKLFVACRTPHCPNHSGDYFAVLDLVLAGLQRWVDDYSGPVSESEKQEKIDTDQAEKNIIDNITALERQQKRAMDLLEKEVYSIEEYLERKADIAANIEAAKKELERIHAEKNKITPEQAIRSNLNQIRHVLEAWPHAETSEQKNALLRSVLSKIEYKRTSVSFRNGSPTDHMEIILYPLLIH